MMPGNYEQSMMNDFGQMKIDENDCKNNFFFYVFKHFRMDAIKLIITPLPIVVV